MADVSDVHVHVSYCYIQRTKDRYGSVRYMTPSAQLRLQTNTTFITRITYVKSGCERLFYAYSVDRYVT